MITIAKIKLVALDLNKKSPIIFQILKFFNYKYYTAFYYSYIFEKYYIEARRIYKLDTGLSANCNINDLTIKTYNPNKKDNHFELPTDYIDIVKKISIEVREKFKKSTNCNFFPQINKESCPDLVNDIREIKNREVQSVQLKDSFIIDGLNELILPIVEILESSVYGSYVFVDKVYIYRTLKCKLEPQGSALWHFDNHPNQVTKAMIYLNDVGECNGGMEVYRSEDGSIIKFKSKPGLLNPFYPSRINKSRLAKIAKENYFIPHKLIGPQGFTFLFSENILHRATLPTEKYRDVVLLQFKPSHKKIVPPVSKKHTGSFYDEDVILNPSQISQVKKPAMASG